MQKSLAIHQAFVAGDLESLKQLLDDPTGFPNCQGYSGVGDIILEYAIYHSPLPFIEQLLGLGADTNYENHAGFPSLIATLSTNRPEKYQILELLLSHGADIQQRGHNDYTPLHYAASIQDIQALKLLLAHGADLNARTRIDDCATPLEEVEMLGRQEAAAFLREAMKDGT